MLDKNQIELIQNLTKNNKITIDEICTKAEIQMIKQQPNWNSELTNNFQIISPKFYRFNTLCSDL